MHIFYMVKITKIEILGKLRCSVRGEFLQKVLNSTSTWKYDEVRGEYRAYKTRLTGLWFEMICLN